MRQTVYICDKCKVEERDPMFFIMGHDLCDKCVQSMPLELKNWILTVGYPKEELNDTARKIKRMVGLRLGGKTLDETIMEVGYDQTVREVLIINSGEIDHRRDLIYGKV